MSLLDNTKQLYLDRVDSIEKIALDFNFPSIVSNIESLKNEINKSDLRVSVLGEFNEGKSTFLNALLNLPKEKHLWMDMNEATSVLTEIKYGEVEKGFAYYRETEEAVEFSLSDLKDFTATDEAARKYSKTVVFINNEILKEGVIFIDTPGVNTLDQTKFETTLSAIKNSHAAIFITSRTEIPLNQKQFIADSFSNDVHKLFCVLNLKQNGLSTEEENRLKASFQNSIFEMNEILIQKKIEGRINKFFIVNAVKALRGKNNSNDSLIKESLIKIFEEEFRTFLKNDKYAVIISRINAKFARVKNEIINLLKTGKESLNLDNSKYEELLTQLEKDLGEVKIAEEQISKGLSLIVNDSRDEYLTNWGRFRTELSDYIDNKCDSLDLTSAETAKLQIKSLQKQVERRVMHWLETQNATTKRHFEFKLNEYSREIDRELKRLSSVLSDGYKEFNIDLNFKPDDDTLTRTLVELILILIIDFLLPGGFLIAIFVRIFGKSLGDKIGGKVTEWIKKLLSNLLGGSKINSAEYKAILKNEFERSIEEMDESFRQSLNSAFAKTEEQIMTQVKQSFSDKIKNIKMAVQNAHKQKDEHTFNYENQVQRYDAGIQILNSL